MISTVCEEKQIIMANFVHSGAKAADYIYKAECPEEDLKTLIHEHGQAVVLVAVHGKSFDNYQGGVLEDCEYDAECPEESYLPKTDPKYKVCKQVKSGLKPMDACCVYSIL